MLHILFRHPPLAGDAFVNQRFAEGLKCFDLAAFGGHRRINRRTTRIQIRRDALLLGQRWEKESGIFYSSFTKCIAKAARNLECWVGV